ncbi:MAG: hypothetical protein LQ350_002430 [Teloschistes chrysophthalmus]|nr:MAG: hypothetical protein LQ350_002430 [Niorma chrysophthalma]
MQVTILPALPADYPTLASILPLANAHNPIEQLMFRHNPTTPPSPTDTTTKPPTHTEPPSARWAMTQFQNAQTTPSSSGTKTHILKAVVSSEEDEGGEGQGVEGKAVGFAIVRVIDAPLLPAETGKGEGLKGEGKGDVMEGLEGEGKGDGGDGGDGEVNGEEAFEKTSDEMLEPEFCGMYMNGLKEIYEGWARGKPKHGYWSTLMILPRYQRQGIGTAVIAWALQHLELNEMPVFICAQPDGVRLYEKMGWREVGGLDVRLGEWGGRLERGWKGKGGEGEGEGEGVHRTACMVREAGGGRGEVEGR